MNKKQRPSQKKRAASVAAVLCFVAAIALVGTYTFNDYKRTQQKEELELAKKEDDTNEEKEKDFYDGDDEDFIGEFEEDPGVLSRKNRKRERPAKVQKTEPKRPAPAHPELYNKDEDDDLEFLDLNDL